MTDRELLKMALDELNMQTPLDKREFELRNAAIEALRQALAQPEQDYERGFVDGMQKQMQSTVEKAVNAMTKRKWVGLTRRELDIATLGLEDLGDCYKAIEAKLKEKNDA